jgi:hypothetical protein
MHPLPHCTHTAGVTLPGGLLPQPLEAVVKENSEKGASLQQSHADGGQVFAAQAPGPWEIPP